MTDSSRLKVGLRGILARHEGRAMAITAACLSESTGHPDRAVRLAIEELIDDGFPVVSTTDPPAGYFVPVSIDEARQYTQSLRSRAVMIFLRRRKVIRNTAMYLRPAVQERLL